MTRLRFKSDQLDEEIAINQLNDVSEDDEEINEMSDEWMTSVRIKTKDDPILKSIYRRITISDWTNVSMEERPYHHICNELQIRMEVIMYGSRVCIPECLRKEAIDECHEFHTGVKSTMNRLKMSCWWPTIVKDTRSFVQDCQTCQKIRPIKKKPLSCWPKSELFERIHIDFFNVQGIGDILIMVDSASGWIECSSPMERTSKNVIDALFSVFTRFGVPKKIVSDNAHEFTSQQFNEWCRANAIEKVECPPYHPQSNGCAERAVQTVKNGIRAWKLNISHLPFIQYLQRLLLHYRATFERSNGMTPAQMMFGRSIRLPMTRTYVFGQDVLCKYNKVINESKFLLQHGSNTSWVLDKNNSLRLAHNNQLTPYLLQTDRTTSNSSQPTASPSSPQGTTTSQPNAASSQPNVAPSQPSAAPSQPNAAPSYPV